MKTYHILNLGAGVQSTALYLMSLRQDEPELVPLFDYAIFADTHEEPKAVYTHIEWLKTLSGPPILTGTAGKLGSKLTRELSPEVHACVTHNLRFNRQLQNLKDHSKSCGSLFAFNPSEDWKHLPDGPERDAVDAYLANPKAKKRLLGTHFASIPAFMAKNEGVKDGINRRQCTREYKVDIVEEVFRRQVLGLTKRKRMPGDVRAVQYMGLSYDEPGRVAKVKARFQDVGWSEPRFPLFDLEMTRGDCAAYLKDIVPHKVPRSACVICPYRRNAEWRDMKENDSDGWTRAVEIDKKMRHPLALCGVGMDRKAYLHESCVPLDQADIEANEPPLDRYVSGFFQECEGMCGA